MREWAIQHPTISFLQSQAGLAKRSPDSGVRSNKFTWQGGWWGTWGSGSGREAVSPRPHGPAESCLSGAHDLEDNTE